jgi:ABC-type nitrate/sulfonate/bicarbonate transport system permease component
VDQHVSLEAPALPRLIGRLPSAATLLRRASGLLFIVALIVAWQLVGSAGTLYYLPSFTTVLSHMGTLLSGSDLTSAVLPSAGRAAAGYLIGGALGLTVGVLIGYHRSLDPWVRPVLEFFRALPAPLAVSLGLLLLGFSTSTRIAVIAFECFWPVVVNADDGARRVDQQLLDTSRVAQVPRRKILLRVVLPASLPQAVVGLRFAVSIALVMMVISELIGASSGLGYFISNAENTFAYADLWAAVVVLGIIGWLATSLFSLAERRILFWHREQRD